MQSARVPLVLTGLAVLIAIVRVATLWSELPPMMASHFGASGAPDGWQSRGNFFLMFGSVTGLTVMLLATVPLWLRWIPVDLVNLPNRHYWLAPERKVEALARLGGFMNWMTFMTAALMLVILELVMQANIERRGLANAPFLIAIGAYLVGTIIWVAAIFRAFRLPVGVRNVSA